MAEIVPDKVSDQTVPDKHEACSLARADLEKTLSKSLLACIQALLQLHPSLTQRDVGHFGGVLDVAEASKALPQALLSEYFHYLDKARPCRWRLSSLLTMVDAHPQLLMEVSPTYQHTILQVADLSNSEVGVRQVLKMMFKELAGMDTVSSTRRNDHLHAKVTQFLFVVEKKSDFTTFQLARLVGHNRIVHMIENCQKPFTSSTGNMPSLLDASSVLEARDCLAEKSQFLAEEELERKAHIQRIGEMLTSHLQPMEYFSSWILEDTSLGYDFRLHNLVTTKLACNWRCCYDTFANMEWVLRKFISKQAEGSLLFTFLDLCDNTGRQILHYLADLSPGHGICDLLFTTLMHELLQRVPRLDRDSAGRTSLHLAAAQGFAKRVEYFAKDERTDLNATFGMPFCWMNSVGNVGNVEGISALSLAATHNHFEVCEESVQFSTL